MKDLIFIGAGGLGREALFTALDILEADPETPWRVKGFITDIVGDFYEKDTGGYRILGTIKDHVVEENNVYVLAVADIPFKKRVSAEFLEKGATFINLIHPSVRIHHSLKIGIGNIIQVGCGFTTDVTIGDFTLINGAVRIGHDATIGSYCTLFSGCAINGYCKVGDGALLGTNVILYPHATVGEGARVAAGSVVLKHVKPGDFVIGNPAVRV